MTQRHNHNKQPIKRQDIYAEIRAHVRRLRQKIDPQILADTRKLIVSSDIYEHELTKDGHVKIDRKRNIEWVSTFLSSPEGARLKEKLVKE